VRIDASSGVIINTARVVKADVPAVNGVIHVIDAVLLPPSSK
jgi:transforming growth factor-beta-induced protein